LSITIVALMQGFLKEFFMPVMIDVIRVPAWIPIVQLPDIYAFVNTLQSLISALLFAAMYFIGKRIALKQHLWSVLTILMSGSWGGLFLGQALAMGPEVVLPTWQNYPYFMIWQFWAMFPSAIFILLLSFAALAVAYIRGLRENLSRDAGAKPVVDCHSGYIPVQALHWLSRNMVPVFILEA
jgi:hypothetical protein